MWVSPPSGLAPASVSPSCCQKGTPLQLSRAVQIRRCTAPREPAEGGCASRSHPRHARGRQHDSRASLCSPTTLGFHFDPLLIGAPMITHSHSSSARPRGLSRPLSALLAIVAAGTGMTFPLETRAADGAPTGATVTGTHIRGSTDSAFPIVIYNREVIESSGASTLQAFIQTIPQNFNGGASEHTVGSVTGGGNA